MTKLCIICGKPFEAMGCAKTCSTYCQKQRKKNNHRAYLQRADVRARYNTRERYEAAWRRRKLNLEYRRRCLAITRAWRRSENGKLATRSYRQKPETKAVNRNRMRAIRAVPPSVRNFFQLINAVNQIKRTNEATEIANHS